MKRARECGANSDLPSQSSLKSSSEDLLRKYVNPLTGTGFSDRYAELKVKRETLPVFAHRKSIVDLVQKNQIVLLSGETGSGKTTQVPCYVARALGLLESRPQPGSSPGLVICTQPRRVAAMSIAKRVAEELDVRIGSAVGYLVRFDSRISTSETQLAYYTDGMLLRECIRDPDLGRVRAVIVDEAHERTVQSDVLLGLLKLLAARRPELKIIVMSATLDVAVFQNFFPSAAIIRIPGRIYQVEITYVPIPVRDYVSAAAKKAVELHVSRPVDGGDILVFLPGEQEIKKAMALINYYLEASEDEGLANLLEGGDDISGPDSTTGCAGEYIVSSVTSRGSGCGSSCSPRTRTDQADYASQRGRAGMVPKALVLPLYGSLPLSAQERVFSPPETAQTRKIVISTNIAETSVTIDGVSFVVDSCFHKQKYYSTATCVDYLLPTLISRASAEQRAGRAGRTRCGECFRLVTADTFARLAPQSFPDIFTTGITDTVLLLLRLGQNPLTFPFVTPPPGATILDAFVHLSFLGAVDENSCQITALGRQIIDIPLASTAARAVLAGAENSCALDCAAVCAVLEAPGSLFTHNANDSAIEARRAELGDSSGDHLSLILLLHHFLARRGSAEWCASVGLQQQTMAAAARIYEQISGVLERLGLPRESVLNENRTRVMQPEIVIRSLLKGLFATVGFRSLRQDIYHVVRSNQLVKLHFSSRLCRDKPQWVLFNQLEMHGADVFSRLATTIERSWLHEANSEFFKPEELTDEVIKKELELETQLRERRKKLVK